MSWSDSWKFIQMLGSGPFIESLKVPGQKIKKKKHWLRNRKPCIFPGRPCIWFYTTPFIGGVAMWKYLPGGEPRGKLRASQSSLSGEKVHPASPDLHQSEVWCQVVALKSSALFLLLYHLFIRQNSGHWTLPVYKWEDLALQPCSFFSLTKSREGIFLRPSFLRSWWM